MERGLLWLPLLILFIGLTWAGWNEYRKLEAYKVWAQQFERAKYDIYAVLGQTGQTLTWGKPTRQGPVNIQTLTFSEVQTIRLEVDRQPVAPATEKVRGRIALGLTTRSGQHQSIPFSDWEIAQNWFNYLQPLVTSGQALPQS
ncbi:hypothetical protein IQ241_15695 [Romeria aff. gracilis LEGE 07310]|uniref:Uncharacterized protein n=1 Tax=Vasconcelosia minhoensis LEGE 07310 TaxID=915328 RepID=A0A8J7AQS7_9CYAN|nr:hypothetical protein [Romeria gracilis]MBE9078721.1 hypothetical protein [Romeria aff. gracilis LEGE 07310]